MWKAQRKAVSCGNEINHLSSARTLGRTVRRSAPHRLSGRCGRLWQGGSYAAIPGSRRQARTRDCAPSVFTPRVRRAHSPTLQQWRVAAPATFGATKTQLDSSSNSFRSARSHEPLLNGIDRARYRSHSSFVDGRDKHLDAILRQRRAPSLTQRLQGRSRRRPARHK